MSGGIVSAGRRASTGVLAALAVVAVACGGGNGSDVLPDLPLELPVDGVSDVVPDAVPDVLADVPRDAFLDASPDVEPDVPAPVIPETLGGSRPAALYVPDDYDPAKAWPLVVALHGYSLNGIMMALYFGLPERVTPKGFVLVTPDGTVDSQGNPFWNASPSCCNFDGSPVDDVAYLRSLVDEAKQVLNIDADRVVLLGFSNGAFMSLRLACDASDVFAGIATLGGSMAVGAPCSPAHPVSILAIHGTVDDIIPYPGGTFRGLAEFVGAEDLVRAWKDRDGCTQGPVAGAVPLDYDASVDGAETTTRGWSGCLDGTRVDLWRMEGSGHNPPFTEAFRDALLDHLLPAVPPARPPR